eukprot:comp91714_c0_seq1/m.48580 comp91714_c0_seq1/g.48580  ORF comp91714_c0_seq1/g.48580 comp91714_c0_seq1/m.48580 type:complete len:185 (-) comp91714_c0_seq1:75-629(-)
MSLPWKKVKRRTSQAHTGGEMLDKEKLVLELLSYKHHLSTTTYFSPTYCANCDELLKGIMRQGVQCSKCKLNFHAQCSKEYKQPGVCPALLQDSDILERCELDDLHSTGLCRPRIFEGFPIIYASLRFPKIPHEFEEHTYNQPTICTLDKKVLLGIRNQGLQCIKCKYNIHPGDEDVLKNNCEG